MERLDKGENTAPRRLSRGTYVENDLLTSRAFLALNCPAAYCVYLIFRLKLQFPPKDKESRIRRDRTGRESIGPLNSRELQFSYREAREFYGMSSGVFGRALRELHRVGLIDVVKSGMGLERDCSVYGLSKRWRKFGTPEFECREWPQADPARYRFKKENRYGANARK